MLIVNYVNIANVDYDMYRLLKKSVSRTRQKKADQYYFIDDAKRCIFAELLLQYSFFQKRGSLGEVQIEYNEFGKPFIQGEEGFLYNVSHAGKWVVIAYGDVQVGVDIEKICNEQDDMPINMFAQEERAYINEVMTIDRVKRFTQMWTLKESYVKYLGTGLSTDLNSFSILVDDIIKVKARSGIQENVKLESHLLQQDYYLSTCSAEKEVTMREIDLIDLIEFAHNKR